VGTVATVGTSERVHSGQYALKLGTATPSTDNSVTQNFTIGSTASYLALSYSVVCPDTVYYDWATVTLHDNTTNAVYTVLGHTCTNDGSWQTLAYDVSALRGHSVSLTLLSHDDNYSGDPTYTYFDDVRVF
jgi:serine protease